MMFNDMKISYLIVTDAKEIASAINKNITKSVKIYGKSLDFLIYCNFIPSY